MKIGAAKFFLKSNKFINQSFFRVIQKNKKDNHEEQLQKQDVKIIKLEKHSGVIEGENIEIKYLNCGKVTANIVKINKTNGGEVTSNQITVNELGSSTVLIATNLVEIFKITGKKNQIIINFDATSSLFKNILEISKRINMFKEEFCFLSPLIEAKKLKIEQDEIALENLHEEELLSNFNKTKYIQPVNYLVKKRELEILKKDQKKLEDAFLNIKLNIQNDTDDFYILKKKIIFPTILNHSSWGQNTKIKFNISELHEEIYCTINEKDTSKRIVLDFDISGKFKIDIGDNI